MADPSNGRGALAAGGLAAILASTCCLGPLVLITLGFSGAWIGNLTALEPYRPIFIGVALVALAAMGTIGPWGYIGFVPILTGLAGTCPLYSVLGFSTCPIRKSGA